MKNVAGLSIMTFPTKIVRFKLYFLPNCATQDSPRLGRRQVYHGSFSVVTIASVA